MSLVRPALLVSFLAAGAASVSCNEHPLVPLGDTLFVTRVEISERLKSNDVDILWVVDNSPSMREEQIELGRRFDEFIAALSDLDADFRMAVISTDPADRGRFRTGPGNVQARGCLEPPSDLDYCRGTDIDPPYLESDEYGFGDPNTPVDAVKLAADFRCIASAGDCGNSFEFGLEALRDSLNRETLSSANGGFVRDEAFLLVVFLTDEDDCSNNGAFPLTRDADCYAAERRGDLVPTQDFYDFLVDLKDGQEEKILLAGIIGPNDGLPLQTYDELDRDGPRFSCNSELSTSEDAVDARDGERYRELIDLVGSRGVEENICQGNFSAALANIGEILREALDVNCLNTEPRSCVDDTDCADGVACLDFDTTDPENPLFCANFEVALDVQYTEDGSFETLVPPGPAGQAEPDPGAQFTVDYDAGVCLYNVAFSFEPGSRPPTGSRFRVAYPQSTEVVTSQTQDEESGGAGN